MLSFDTPADQPGHTQRHRQQQWSWSAEHGWQTNASSSPARKVFRRQGPGDEDMPELDREQWVPGGDSVYNQWMAASLLAKARRDRALARRAFGRDDPVESMEEAPDGRHQHQPAHAAEVRRRLTMPWPGSMARTVPVEAYVALRRAAAAAEATVSIRDHGGRGRKKAKQVASGGWRRGAKGGWLGVRATVIGTVSDIKHFGQELLDLADRFGTNTATARKYYTHRTARDADAAAAHGGGGGSRGGAGGRSSGSGNGGGSRAARAGGEGAAAGGGDGSGDEDDADDGLDPAASNRSDATDTDATSSDNSDETRSSTPEPSPAEEADFSANESDEETMSKPGTNQEVDKESGGDGGSAPTQAETSSSSIPRPAPLGSWERVLLACNYGLTYCSNRSGGESAAFISAAGPQLNALKRFGLGPPIALEELPGALREGCPTLKVVACQCSMLRELYTKVCLPLVLMQMLPVRKASSMLTRI